MRSLSILIFAVLINSFASAQLMPFGFIKNCMSYGRTTVTDELTKKQFILVERNQQVVTNPLMAGSTYYSNEKDRNPALGEVAVLSQINGSKLITEISFRSGSKNNSEKNFTDVYNQMVNFFKDEKSFKSARYKTEVKYFFRDKNYYYTYTVNNIPTIVVSNYKIETDYFAN